MTRYYWQNIEMFSVLTMCVCVHKHIHRWLPQGYSYFCLPSAGIISMGHHTQFITCIIHPNNPSQALKARISLTTLPQVFICSAEALCLCSLGIHHYFRGNKIHKAWALHSALGSMLLTLILLNTCEWKSRHKHSYCLPKKTFSVSVSPTFLPVCPPACTRTRGEGVRSDPSLTSHICFLLIVFIPCHGSC